ncbi:MAG: response regulator [Paraglaciecola sp.]|uniref:response regulator n=1 Tax=Paraglaciecola sp. TaxID=1920173 RepID=UPI00329745A5
MHFPSVLIIDDSELERYMLVHQLKKIGIKTLVEKSDAISGLSYLNGFTTEKSKDIPPKLIILDVNMPVMNGFEFLKKFTELREKNELSQCQVLMYTGSENVAEHNKALQYDFVKGILIKGQFEVEELRIQLELLCKS